MSSSVMLYRVALVRSDVSEERTASIMRVTRIGEVGTTLAATGINSISIFNSQRESIASCC
jgi:demethoxyubiquinone hydroxylase (CLK1/Coq7/Cat5 family)